MLRQTTPVPNRFFDQQMKDLSSVALRVYLKICRNTNGWRNEQGEMKQRDWISHSQFSEVGVSSRSMTKAIEELLSMKLISVTDEYGNSLDDSKKRKYANRIFYGLIPQTNTQTAIGIAKYSSTNAKPSTRPTQNLPSTKEILQKSSLQTLPPDQRQTDRQRLEQLLSQEHQKQHRERDNWR